MRARCTCGSHGMRMCAASAKKRRGEGSGVASARCACWRCEQIEGTVARVGAQLRGGMMAANAPTAVLRPQRAGTESRALVHRGRRRASLGCICPCLPLGHTQSRAATDCRKPSCHAAATHRTTRQHDAGTTHGSARAHTHDTRGSARQVVPAHATDVVGGSRSRRLGSRRTLCPDDASRRRHGQQQRLRVGLGLPAP